MDFTLILILVVSLIGYMVFRFLTRRKKPVIKDQTSLIESGFSPIPFPEADLKQAIDRLHHKYPDQQLAVTDVFQKITDQGYVYILDLEDQAEKEPFFLARDMVAIRSPDLNLPRITIMTRFKALGGFGTLMDRFVSRHSNWDSNLQELIQLNYDSYPAISQRYLIFSPAGTEETTRQFLSDSRLAFLVKLDTNYVIDTLGDMLTLITPAVNPNESRKTQIERSVQDALLLARLFKSDTPLSPLS
jgi:hypothetical protein